MKQVVNSMKRKDSERRIAVLKLELDYELATLYDAIKENDENQKSQCKVKLEKLRQEMNRLKA
jgi:hypothetical protein